LDLQVLGFPAVILISITSLILLLSSDWRLSVAALAIQYAGVFVLVAASWPLELAVVKLVAGWMAGAVLGMALVGNPENALQKGPLGLAGGLFRFLAATMMGMVTVSIAPRLVEWVPQISLEQAYAGGILIGLGLLHLGLTVQPLRVAFGLLTILAGFEILYAAVEASTLVTGLLAGVTLGLALVSGYLTSGPEVEPSE
jgi:hypothetical protein